MSNFWENLSYKFIVSTGRTGTKFLTHFFTIYSDKICIRHEPDPKNLKLKWQFGTDKINIENAIEKFKKSKYNSYKDVKKEFYIESNPYLIFLIPIIREVFLDYKIVHIVRDGRDWLRSAMNRGVYSSIIDYLPLQIINFFRFILKDNIRLPPSKKIKFQTYYRDIWRFRIDDFKEKTHFKSWAYMTQFEKLAWMWSKINKVAYKEVQDDTNVKLIKFEDIFNKGSGYPGLKQIIQFFDLNNLWQNFNGDLDLIFSEKINKSQAYSFPHWKNWKREWVTKFNQIAGETMELYKYY